LVPLAKPKVLHRVVIQHYYESVVTSSVRNVRLNVILQSDGFIHVCFQIAFLFHIQVASSFRHSLPDTGDILNGCLSLSLYLRTNHSAKFRIV
jgi:hypothetical protein